MGSGTVVAIDERIVLGHFVPADADIQCRMDADPGHRRRFDCPDDFQPSLAHARRTIARWEADRRVAKRYTLAVRDRVDGELVGGCELLPKGDGVANISYWTCPWRRGQGIATRAVRLLCEQVAPRRGFTWIELPCDADNEPSRRIATRCAFRLVGERDRQLLHVRQLNQR